MTDDRLAEQQAYYRARAPEYDEWFLREGRYDRGPGFRARWAGELEGARRALDVFGPTGRVLEIACGTGLWTERLLRHAERVVALDLAPEMLAEARQRLGDRVGGGPGAAVELVEADIYEWSPQAPFDVVFFGFFLSHVPPSHFDRFFARVRDLLAPGGRFFFVDNLREETSTAGDHTLPPAESVAARRRLNDGREFRIIKVFYDPPALAERLAALGWEATVTRTERFFLLGWGTAA